MYGLCPGKVTGLFFSRCGENKYGLGPGERQGLVCDGQALRSLPRKAYGTRQRYTGSGPGNCGRRYGLCPRKCQAQAAAAVLKSSTAAEAGAVAAAMARNDSIVAAARHWSATAENAVSASEGGGGFGHSSSHLSSSP